MRETASSGIDRKFLFLTAGVVALVLYGSFYPFHFASRGGSPVEAVLATYRQPSSRGDTIGNILFYMPLGFVALRAFSRTLRPVHIIWIAAACGTLSFVIEVTQYYDVSRVASMADVYANVAGALCGATIALLAGRVHGSWSPTRGPVDEFAALLLVAWLAARLFPYVPSLDLQQIKDALKPVLLRPAFAPLPFYRHLVTGLTAAALLACLAGRRRSRLLTPAALAGVLCIRILLPGAVLSLSEVAGYAAAALCWAALSGSRRLAIPSIAVLMAVLIAAESLSPFVLLPAPRPFGWIPFHSFMGGSISVNLVAFAEKVFLYGSLLWLLVGSGLRLGGAAALAGSFVTALRMFQTHLPGRSAEITDTVMTLLLAALMAILGRNGHRKIRDTSTEEI